MVDDETHIRELVRIYFEDEGLTVVEQTKRGRGVDLLPEPLGRSHHSGQHDVENRWMGALTPPEGRR